MSDRSSAYDEGQQAARVWLDSADDDTPNPYRDEDSQLEWERGWWDELRNLLDTVEDGK